MDFLTSNFFFQLLATLFAIVIALYVYMNHVIFNYWKSRGVSHLDPVVPFGNLWPVVSAKLSIGEYMRDLHLQFKDKPVFGVYSFYRASLVIRDPDLIRFILTKEFSHFQSRGVYCDGDIDPLTIHLFSLPGEEWRFLRTKFTPTFTSSKMKHMFATVKECSDNLFICLTEEIQKKKVIEVKDLIARYTTDVIASVAFGVECNSLQNPNAEFRRWGRKFMEPKPIRYAFTILCPSLLKLFRIRSIDEGVTKFIINAVKEIVEYRGANNITRNDFLDLVIQLMDKGYVQGDNNKTTPDPPANATEKITILQAAAQVFVFWVAGFETSSSAATHCLYELAKNQEVQKKLADEINRVLKEFGSLSYESLNAMPYLHKVVLETLRLYPSLPLLNRECGQDVKLPGTDILVEKGTPIIISVWGLHTDPDVFPNPDKFDPERFSEENIAGRHRYAFLPFGDGPRNCIGMRFGLMQVKIGLASILSKYRFEMGPDTPQRLNVDVGNFLLCPKDEVFLRVERR